ncbi:hypothetical protein Yalta_150 [Yalta virus]|nr:hypothetical protein Yalta_150 [Yalta virus]
MHIVDLAFILYQYGSCFEKYKENLTEVNQQRIVYTIDELYNIILSVLNKINGIFEQKFLDTYNFNTAFPHSIEHIYDLIKNSQLKEQEKRAQTLFTTLLLSLKDIVVDNIKIKQSDFTNKILNNLQKVNKTQAKNVDDEEGKEEDEDDQNQVSNLLEFKNNLERLGLPYFDFSKFNQIN